MASCALVLNTVFTRKSAAPEKAPPSNKRRIRDKKVNKRRSTDAALTRGILYNEK